MYISRRSNKIFAIGNSLFRVSLSRYHTVCLNHFYQLVENDWKSNGLVLGVAFDKPMSWRSHVELVSTYYESSGYLKLLSEILMKEVKRAYLSTLSSKTFSDRVENTYFLSLGMVAVIKFIQITYFLFVNVLIVGYTVSNDLVQLSGCLQNGKPPRPCRWTYRLPRQPSHYALLHRPLCQLLIIYFLQPVWAWVLTLLSLPLIIYRFKQTTNND